MAILVLAEHDNATMAPATRSVVTAAKEIAGHGGGDVTVLVAGENCAGVAEAAAAIDGVAKVLVADDAIYKNSLAENMALLVQGLGNGYGHILAPATTFGKNVAPRIAALADVQQISEITEVVAADTFVRPIYAGNAMATVQSLDQVRVITVRGTSFEKAADGTATAPIEALGPAEDTGLALFVGAELSASVRPELTNAGIIVSGGRGLQNAENFQMLEALADQLNAAIGASRAAVDAGFVPNDYQVGQTGKIVAPELYIAIGISGAIQHLAGMKDSKVIVAINKDEDAPIFQIADYGFVGDLFEFLPEFTAELDKLKKSGS